jgi:hypothetical protein
VLLILILSFWYQEVSEEKDKREMGSGGTNW